MNLLSLNSTVNRLGKAMFVQKYLPIFTSLVSLLAFSSIAGAEEFDLHRHGILTESFDTYEQSEGDLTLKVTSYTRRHESLPLMHPYFDQPDAAVVQQDSSGLGALYLYDNFLSLNVPDDPQLDSYFGYDDHLQFRFFNAATGQPQRVRITGITFKLFEPTLGFDDAIVSTLDDQPLVYVTDASIGSSLNYKAIASWGQDIHVTATWNLSSSLVVDGIKIAAGYTSAFRVYAIEAEPYNNDPEFDSVPVIMAQETVPYAYQPEARDDDQDILAYSLITAPTTMQIDSETGLIQWLPEEGDAGNHNVVVRSEDIYAGFAEQSYTITVLTRPNRAPIITSQAITSATETLEYSYQIVAEDADGDTLIYTLSEAPIGATLNGSNIDWTPTYEQAGSHDFTFIVSDGDLSIEQSFSVTVANTNREPVISSVPVGAAAENQTYIYLIEATDADGTTLSYSLAVAPAGAVLIGNSLVWTPGYEQAGSHAVSIQVSDGEATIEQSFSINVANTNREPIIGSVPDETAAENQAYSYLIEATDADGTALSYSLVTAPAGATLSGNTLSWTPGYEQAGSHAVSIQVSDGEATIEQNFNITVANTNREPVIGSVPAETAAENQTYSYLIEATDADGTALSYSLVAAPAGAVLNGNSLIWTPGYEQAGDHAVSIQVSDGEATIEQNFNIAVANTNREPVIGSVPDETAAENQAYSYLIVATDADGTALSYSLVTAPAGATLSGNTLSWTPGYEQAGSHAVSIQVSDGEATIEHNFSINVANTNRQPVITSQAPTSGEELETWQYTVEATDADGEILSYQLQQAPSGMQITANQLTWVPALGQAGNYSFTVQVSDDGATIEQSLTLSIAQADSDNDGYLNVVEDSCLSDAFDTDSIPLDFDGDLICDAMDSDDDNDSVADATDNCPLVENTDQLNTDGDTQGNVCDSDDDNDTVADSTDNCPLISNNDQLDTDGDTQGNVCDSDDDNDSLVDDTDNCPLIENTDQLNTDGDDQGNACDSDDDNDTVADATDNCLLIENTDQLDTDGDTQGNVCDSDDDNDSVADATDNCPLVENTDQLNTDGDDQGNACDSDDDNDTVADSTDNCPLIENTDQLNTDGDTQGNACDSDDDNDTVADSTDNCPLITNNDQANLDNDGLGDLCDDDIDGDGFSNEEETAAGSSLVDANDIPDFDAPVITIAAHDASTAESSVTLLGTIFDNSAMAQFIANNDRFANTDFAISSTATDWNIQIPLEMGDNIINIIATDARGNTATQTVTVERINLSANASLSVSQPSFGSVVQEPTIRVSGQVISTQPTNNIVLDINGINVALTATADVTVFDYTLADVSLNEGSNLISITASFDYELYTDEQIKKTVLVIYQTEQEAIPQPELTLLSPADNSYLSDSSFYLSLDYMSHAGDAQLTVNGNPVALVNSQYGTHSELLSFPQGQSEWQVNAVITDGLGQQSSVSASYYFDNEAPVITLDNAILPVSVENIVNEQPYTLTGIVSDTQLASFTANGQNIDLEPTADPNTYTFSVAVGLSIGQTQSVNLQAGDYSGNTTNREYNLKLDSSVSLGMLLPPENVTLLNFGVPINLQVAARIEGIVDGYTAQGRIINAGTSNASTTFVETELSIGEGLISGYLNTTLEAGEYTLEIELLDGAQLLTKTTRSFKVENVADVSLQLDNVEPANGEQYIETNSPITAYFNKSIDLSKLSIEVTETAHGFSYVNNDPAGTEGFQAKGYQLVRVDIDDERVNGGLSVLPGGRVIAFYPEREFAYDSQIQIIVSYDGEEYSRSRFHTRELPTFVDGSIFDQFGQPVPGVGVEIVELNRLATTDASGVFGFGYGDKAGDTLPDGRYTLQVNAGMKNTRFGTLQKKIFINKGEKTSLSTQTLAALNKEDAFSQLAGGTEVNLARGDLLLDLTHTDVFFPGGNKQGFAMALFTPLGAFPHHYDQMFMPYWLFSVHPMGVEINGDIGIDFALPKLDLIDDYVWDDGASILLLGLDPETDIIVPVGVGVVENHRVKSLRAEYSRLDYIGYAPMPDQAFETMQAYANGDIDLDYLVVQLRSALTTTPSDDGAQ